MRDHPSFHRYERARLPSAGVLYAPDYGVFTRSSATHRPTIELADEMARQLLLAEAR